MASIFFFGCLFRFYDLKAESLWIDEALSVDFVDRSFADMMHRVKTDVHPPFYYILLHFWIRGFGDSELSARMLSTVASVVTLPIFYFFAKKSISQNAAYVALFFLAFSQVHIEYAQEARSYSILVLFTIVSYFSYWSIFSGFARYSYWLYLLSTVGMVYLHIYGLFYLLSQVAVTFMLTLTLMNFRYKKRLIQLHAISLLSLLPWIQYIMSQVLSVSKGYWIEEPDWKSIIQVLISFSGGKAQFLLVIVLVLTYIIAAVVIRKSYMFPKSRIKVWTLLLSWFIVPIVFSFFISKIIVPIFILRPLLPTAIAGILICSMCFDWLSKNGNKLLAYLLVVAWGVLSILSWYESVETIEKEQWREVASDLRKYGGKGSVFIVHAGFCAAAIEYYYPESNVKGFPNDKKDITYLDTIGLDDIVGQTDSVYLIYSHSRDDNGLIQQALNKMGYVQLDEKHYIGIDVLLYSNGRE